MSREQILVDHEVLVASCVDLGPRRKKRPPAAAALVRKIENETEAEWFGVPEAANIQ
jgi:hypothetical protein